jgi:hypothetical protein
MAVPIAYDEDGEPILNSAGWPVPVTVYDAQHFTITPHLVIACIAPEKSTRLLAYLQARDLIDLILEDLVCQPDAYGYMRDDNLRANGWAKLALVQWYALTGEMRVFHGLKVIYDRVDKNRSAPGVKAPYQLLNEAGYDADDHGNLPYCVWQAVGLPEADDALLSVLPPSMATERHRIERQYKLGLECLLYATRDDGHIAEDYGVEEPYEMRHVNPVMDITCWHILNRRGVNKHPLHGKLEALWKEVWSTRDSMRSSDKNFRGHAAQAAISLGPIFGFRA